MERNWFLIMLDYESKNLVAQELNRSTCSIQKSMMTIKSLCVSSTAYTYNSLREIIPDKKKDLLFFQQDNLTDNGPILLSIIPL